ncbi:MAG: GH39 family glycosyl hydrolase [Acidimicrobiales bacterium]
MTVNDSGARGDWERRIGERSRAEAASEVRLDAPGGVVVEGGVQQVTVWWTVVPGAVGYVVARGDDRAGPFETVRRQEADVIAVPTAPFLDTSTTVGKTAWYQVAALPSLDAAPGEWSSAVPGSPLAAGAGRVDVTVDAAQRNGSIERVWRMVGLEHLGEMRLRDDGFGHDVRAEIIDALRIGRRELGTETVRAHHIFDDELGVYREEGGKPVYDFSMVDTFVETLLSIGLRPVIELSFMPAALASDSSATVFQYRAIVSPPRDYGRWGELCGALAEHFVERFGVAEVRQWAFEVWNEPNLEVFWTGTQEDYFHLYDEAARAVKAVDPELAVGGPATAAGEWLEAFAAHVVRERVPVDFISSHTYGNVPIDPRPMLRRAGLGQVPVLWTEWGVAPTHFAPIHDSAFGAPFILRGMKSAQGRLDALAYWVLSDHFEELGRPQRLSANGFGLLTVGNLRKPRFWALKLAAELGPVALTADLTGDGAGSLVEAWAAETEDGQADVVVWNCSQDPGQWAGVPALARTVRVVVEGLSATSYHAEVAYIDAERSNVLAQLPAETVWPGPSEWERLRAGDRLCVEDLGELSPEGGRLEVERIVPMPGVLRLRLSRASPGGGSRVATAQHPGAKLSDCRHRAGSE